MVHYYYDENGVAHLKKKKAPAMKRVRAPPKAKGPKHPMVDGQCPQGTHHVKHRTYVSLKGKSVLIPATCRTNRGRKGAKEPVSGETWSRNQKAGLSRWWSNMTEEQKAEQVRKMAAGRAAARAARLVMQHPAGSKERRKAARAAGIL